MDGWIDKQTKRLMDKGNIYLCVWTGTINKHLMITLEKITICQRSLIQHTHTLHTHKNTIHTCGEGCWCVILVWVTTVTVREVRCLSRRSAGKRGSGNWRAASAGTRNVKHFKTFLRAPGIGFKINFNSQDKETKSRQKQSAADWTQPMTFLTLKTNI